MLRRRLLIVGLAALAGGLLAGTAVAHQPNFTERFLMDRCDFMTVGRNAHWILEPGWQVVLEGFDKKEFERAAITVLDETEMVDGIETRVVEEREHVDGELAEVSRNFMAICRQTGDLYYFGEDVDIYEDGVVVSHDGAWRAGVDGARAGILVPGTALMGSRFFNEVAPGVAMDAAEVVSVNATVDTPAGRFTGCLQILETDPLDPSSRAFKFFAPDMGIVKDEGLVLVSFGFVGP